MAKMATLMHMATLMLAPRWRKTFIHHYQNVISGLIRFGVTVCYSLDTCRRMCFGFAICRLMRSEDPRDIFTHIHPNVSDVIRNGIGKIHPSLKLNLSVWAQNQRGLYIGSRLRLWENGVQGIFAEIKLYLRCEHMTHKYKVHYEKSKYV